MPYVIIATQFPLQPASRQPGPFRNEIIPVPGDSEEEAKKKLAELSQQDAFGQNFELFKLIDKKYNTASP